MILFNHSTEEYGCCITIHTDPASRQESLYLDLRRWLIVSNSTYMGCFWFARLLLQARNPTGASACVRLLLMMTMKLTWGKFTGTQAIGEQCIGLRAEEISWLSELPFFASMCGLLSQGTVQKVHEEILLGRPARQRVFIVRLRAVARLS